MRRNLLQRYAVWLIILCAVFSYVDAAFAGDTLRVAYRANNPYYSYIDKNGDAAGLQVDIMDAIADEMDASKLEYYPMEDISGCLAALESGEVDAILGFPVFYDGDTANIMVSTEITTIDLCMMATNEIVEQIQSGQKSQIRAVFEHNVNNYMNVSSMGANLYYVAGNQQEVLNTVLWGKAEVMLCDEDCMAALLAEKGLEEEFGVVRSNVATVGYSVAVRKSDDSLLRAVNDGIYKIRMSGQYETILRRWAKDDAQVDLRKLISYIVVAAVILVAVALTYFYFSLKVRSLLKRKVKEMTAELEHNIQQLKYEGELRNQIIERTPSVMILCDTLERVILMNAAARDLSGLSSDEGVGLTVSQIPVIGKLFQLVQAKARMNRIDCVDDVLVTCRQEGGEKRKYRCSVTSTHISSSRVSELENGYLLIISDVTKEETKKQALIEKEKSTALSRLVAGIAHEVKNPLTGIQNFADLIKTERDNPKFWDYFAEFVPTEISRISKLIESLMNYARPAKGIKMETDVAQLVDECMYLVNTAVVSSQIQLDIAVPRGLLIYVDRDQIKQVMINIMLNSLEAVEKHRHGCGDSEKLYQIGISAWRESGRVCLQFSDDGGGMSEDDLQSCMDPFFTTKEQGTGLGLAISRQFVQENGGTMDIDSVKDNGTTITLHFREVKHE